MDHGVPSAEGAVAGPGGPAGGFAGSAGLGAAFRADRVPLAVTALLFVALFGSVFYELSKDWWSSPEAGHGLLLAPVSIWMAWKRGIRADARPNHVLGFIVILMAVVIRCAAGLAAELFTMRGSMIMALAGLTIYHFGLRQVFFWWLPFSLASLSVPLPEIVTQALALPLQFRASKMGATLLQWRDVPILLTGNVIRLPGHELFVTEACSGLRSLTALLSVGVLMSAMLLQTIVGRVTLVFLAIPIAIAVNGIRVFMTGFLVYFVSPEFGKGFMHMTEGWLLFLVSLGALGFFAWVAGVAERRALRWKTSTEPANA
ncbi:MAG TPA: exosortase/archaeosortase family protein [Gemmatimonadaceae bacterium]